MDKTIKFKSGLANSDSAGMTDIVLNLKGVGIEVCQQARELP